LRICLSASFTQYTVTNCACGSGDSLADRQTDTQTYSLQYSVIATAGNVTKADIL